MLKDVAHRRCHDFEAQRNEPGLAEPREGSRLTEEQLERPLSAAYDPLPPYSPRATATPLTFRTKNAILTR